MRTEPYSIRDFVPVYNWGNRKTPIVYNENDKWCWLKILRYFNDEDSPFEAFQKPAVLHLKI